MAAAPAPPEEPVLRNPQPIVRFPMPSSPHGPSGVSNAQGVVGPPSRFDIAGTRRPPRETDYICPPSHILLTVKPKSGRKLNNEGIPLSAKRQRRGDVPKLMANFFEIAYKDAALEDVDVDFFGVSHEGVTDFKAAKKYPDSAGRVTAAVQGAVTIFCDHRYLGNAHPGDVLEYVPVDSGLRWTDGHSQFAPCIVQKYTPKSDSYLPKETPEEGLNDALVAINDYNKDAYGDKTKDLGKLREEVSKLLTDKKSAEDILEKFKELRAEHFLSTLTTLEAVGQELYTFADALYSVMNEETTADYTKPRLELGDDVIAEYVFLVFHHVFGKDTMFVNSTALVNSPTSQRSSLITAMYHTVIYAFADYFLQNVEGDKKIDFFSPVNEKFDPISPRAEPVTVRMLEEYGVDPKSIQALKGKIATFSPAQVSALVQGSGDASKMPIIFADYLKEKLAKQKDTLDEFKAVKGDEERIKLIQNIVEAFSGTDNGTNPLLRAFIPNRSFNNSFTLRLTAILPLIYLRNDNGSVGISPYKATGAKFDLQNPEYEVRDKTHEDLVLAARRAIESHTQKYGKAPVISIGTSGYFIDDTNTYFSNALSVSSSDKNRCFATLIEKGIGAYKNEIRVYLNPALRAL